MSDLDAHRHPALAVDLVILTVQDGELLALVMPRDDILAGAFALPGGFVHHGQSLEQTVNRILRDKIGHVDLTFEQLATYGDPARDPRGHVVSIAYLAILPASRLDTARMVAGPQWVRIHLATKGRAMAMSGSTSLPLAFDHAAILADTIRRLRGKIDYSHIGFAFLPALFTLRQVQEVHEAILGRPLLKPAFRRKLLDRGIVREAGKTERGNAFRPAAQYELVPEEKE